MVWGGSWVGAGGEEGIGDEVFGVGDVGDFAFSVFEELGAEGLEKLGVGEELHSLGV